MMVSTGAVLFSPCRLWAAQEIVHAEIDGSLLDSVRTALPISKQRRDDVYRTEVVPRPS